MERLWLKAIFVRVHWSSSSPFLRAFSWLEDFYLYSLFLCPAFQIILSLFLLCILSAVHTEYQPPSSLYIRKQTPQLTVDGICMSFY